MNAARRREGLEFVAGSLAAVALADGAFGLQFAVFEVAQDFLGAVQDRARHAGQAGDDFGQLVVVRGEKGLRADGVVQVLDDGPRERKTV